MFDLSESASTRNLNTASNTISKLKSRCEELSDLINELKIKGKWIKNILRNYFIIYLI
jgi:hypothetical protein